MTKKLYSIIIPHYNSEGKLKRLLLSIPSRSDIQTIVVDDLSTESSILKLIEDHDFSHIEFKMSDRKLTAGGARNAGLNCATGDYILFADSDDYFAPDAFDHFDQATQLQSDLVLFKATSFSENYGDATRHQYLNAIYREPGLFRFLAIDQPYGKLIKRSLIERYLIRFSEVQAGNDILFSAKVSLFAESRLFEKTCVYHISQNDTSITACPTEQNDYLRLSEQINKTLLLRCTTSMYFCFLFLCRRNALTLCDKHPESEEFRGLALFYRALVPRTAIVIHRVYKWFRSLTI